MECQQNKSTHVTKYYFKAESKTIPFRRIQISKGTHQILSLCSRMAEPGRVIKAVGK